MKKTFSFVLVGLVLNLCAVSCFAAAHRRVEKLRSEEKNEGREFSQGSYCTPYEIHDAVLRGDLDRLEKLLHVESIEARNKDGKTPLHLAAERGMLVVVVFLVASGADVFAEVKESAEIKESDLTEESGSTEGTGILAHELATRNGHANVACFLLENIAATSSGTEPRSYSGSLSDDNS